MNEIADAPAGAVPKAIAMRDTQSAAEAGMSVKPGGVGSGGAGVVKPGGGEAALPTLSYASVGRGGTVKFEEVK